MRFLIARNDLNMHDKWSIGLGQQRSNGAHVLQRKSESYLSVFIESIILSTISVILSRKNLMLRWSVVLPLTNSVWIVFLTRLREIFTPWNLWKQFSTNVIMDIQHWMQVFWRPELLLRVLKQLRGRWSWLQTHFISSPNRYFGFFYAILTYSQLTVSSTSWNRRLLNRNNRFS